MVAVKKWMLYTLLALVVVLSGMTVTTGVMLMHHDNELRQTERGDLNHDGKINDNDAIVMFANWGGHSSTTVPGDLNHDGKVDALDLSILLSEWSKAGAQK